MMPTRTLLYDFPSERVRGCLYQGYEPGIPEERQRGVIGDAIVSDDGQHLRLVDSKGHDICSFNYMWGSWHIDEDCRRMSVDIRMIGEFDIFNIKPLT